MEKLKGCPFCGSRDVEFVDEWYEDGECMAVICNNCRAMTKAEPRPGDGNGELYGPGEDQYEEARKVVFGYWNKRNNKADLSSEALDISEKALGIIREKCNTSEGDALGESLVKLTDVIRDLRDQIRRDAADLEPLLQRGPATTSVGLDVASGPDTTVVSHATSRPVDAPSGPLPDTGDDAFMQLIDSLSAPPHEIHRQMPQTLEDSPF